MAAWWDITPDMFLTEGEAARLLRLIRESSAHAPGDAARFLDRVIIETLLFTGMRCSELCEAVLDQIELRARGGHIDAGRKKDRRRIYIPAMLASLLREYVRSARPQLIRPGNHPPHLILNERGNPYERTGLYRRVVRVLGEAGLHEKASVQVLRHTYGYLAYLRTGGNLLFVQRQLGHAHPMVTSVYARLVPENYPQLADRVASARRYRSKETAK
jgi:integrase